MTMVEYIVAERPSRLSREREKQRQLRDSLHAGLRRTDPKPLMVSIEEGIIDVTTLKET